AISPDAHRQVMQLTEALGDRPAGIRNLHPAFASVLIDFDPTHRSHEEVEALIRQRMAAPGSQRAAESRLIEIPVRYGGAEGPDLIEVARHIGLEPERVVELHTAGDYRVYFLGFSPGFPYLGGMPPALT